MLWNYEKNICMWSLDVKSMDKNISLLKLMRKRIMKLNVSFYHGILHTKNVSVCALWNSIKTINF